MNHRNIKRSMSVSYFKQHYYYFITLHIQQLIRFSGLHIFGFKQSDIRTISNLHDITNYGYIKRDLESNHKHICMTLLQCLQKLVLILSTYYIYMHIDMLTF